MSININTKFKIKEIKTLLKNGDDVMDTVSLEMYKTQYGDV